MIEWLLQRCKKNSKVFAREEKEYPRKDKVGSGVLSQGCDSYLIGEDVISVYWMAEKCFGFLRPKLVHGHCINRKKTFRA